MSRFSRDDLDYDDEPLRSPRTTRTVRRVFKYRDDDEFDDYDPIVDDRDHYRGGARSHRYDDDQDVERIKIRERSVSRHGGREKTETIDVTRRRLDPYDNDDDWDRRTRHSHSHSALRPAEVERTQTRIVERHSAMPTEVDDDSLYDRRRSPSVDVRERVRITERRQSSPRRDITITERRQRSPSPRNHRDDTTIREQVKITERRNHSHSPEIREQVRITEHRDNSSRRRDHSESPETIERLKVVETRERGHSNHRDRSPEITEQIKITERSRRASSPEDRTVREHFRGSSPERKEITITERVRRNSSPSRDRGGYDRRDHSASPPPKEIKITETTHFPSRDRGHDRNDRRDRSASPPPKEIKITETTHFPSRDRGGYDRRDQSASPPPKEIKITETHFNADGTNQRSELRIKEGPGAASTKASTRAVSNRSDSPRSLKSVRITVNEDRESNGSGDSRPTSRHSHHTQRTHHTHRDDEVERYVRSTEFVPVPYPEPMQQQQAPQPIIIRSDPAPAPQPIIIHDSSPREIVIRQEPYFIEREREREPERQLVRREHRPRHVEEEEDDYYYERQIRRGGDDHGRELAVRDDRRGDHRSRSRHHQHREHREHGRGEEDEDVIIRRRVRRVSRSRSRDRHGSPASHHRHLLEGAIGGAVVGELIRHRKKSSGQDPGSRLGQLAGYGALGALGAEGITKANELRHRSKSRRRHDEDRYDDRDYDRGRGDRGHGDDRHKRARSKSIGKKEALVGVAALAGLGALAYAAGKRKSNKAVVEDDRSGRGRSSNRDPATVDGRSSNNRIATAGAIGGSLAALASTVSRSRSRNDGRSKSKVRDAIPIVATGLTSAAAAGLIERHRNNKKERARSASAPPAARDDADSLVQYGDSPIPVEDQRRGNRSHSRGRSHSDASDDSSDHHQARDVAGASAASGIAALSLSEANQVRERRRAERERRRAARNGGGSPTAPYNGGVAPPQDQYYQPNNGFQPQPSVMAAGPMPPPPVGAYHQDAYNANMPGPYNPAEFGPTQGPNLGGPETFFPPPPPPAVPSAMHTGAYAEPSPGTIPHSAAPPQMQMPPPADYPHNAPEIRQERREMYGNDHNPNVSQTAHHTQPSQAQYTQPAQPFSGSGTFS
jgi:hypothetical protein